MGARGRKSAADLTVIDGGAVAAVERPGIPAELTDEQAGEWRKITESLPADWFGEATHHMLAQLCRHIVSARHVAQLITVAEAAKNFDVTDYDRLLKCQERESRCIASLSVKMRISQSTEYGKFRKRDKETKNPWDLEGYR